MSPLSPNYLFSADDADVVLTSNDVQPREFRVHSSLLIMASPFFRDLFSLPRSPRSPIKGSEKALFQTIPCSEDAETLDTVLRFLYPVADPEIPTLDHLIPVLTACMKYDLTCVVTALRKILLSPKFLNSEPLRVFAIACRFELYDDAKTASQYTLRYNLAEYPLTDDFKYVTAHTYHQLLTLHRRRGVAAQDLLRLPYDVKCKQCNSVGHAIYNAPKWWSEFKKLAQEELSVRPTTDVIFSVRFLSTATQGTRCPRCPDSMLESVRYLEEIKTQIDALPRTI